MTLHDAELALTASHHVLRCHEKRPAVNGEADQLAIHSDGGYVLINCQAGVDFYALAAACPDVIELTRVKTPTGFHLYYQGEAQLPQVLATNRDGSPRITVTEYAVTYPTPGYALENGLLTRIPAKSLEFWRKFKSVAAFQTVKPERIVPIPGPLPEIVPDLEKTAPSMGAAPSVRELTDIELAEQQTILTESNVAMVFEHKYRDSLRYCHSWGEWLVWTGAYWKPDRTLLAHDYAATLCRTLNREMKASPAKSSFSRGVEFLCRSKRCFATETAAWDSDNYLFNTTAGTLDLRTGQMRPHSPADHLTQCAAFAPSDAPRPIFDRFLRDITLEDSAQAVYLQTLFGSCLSGAVEDNFLAFLFGSGQNGKNCLGDLMQKIMGSYAVTINADTLMAPRGGSAQHLTFIADLRGKRLALSSEVEEGSYFNESRLKSLTGDAMLKANRMRQDPFEFKKTHHHVIYGNHRPLLRIVDEGMKSRLHMVPFRAHFPPEARDPEMAAKLLTEAPQVLQWLIDGHELWMEAGKVLRKCSAVQSETESYFLAQSTNDMWIAETCDIDEQAQEGAKALYQSFKTWKESRGEGVQSQTRWGEWMSQRFQKHLTHGRVIYRGVTLKPCCKKCNAVLEADSKECSNCGQFVM